MSGRRDIRLLLADVDGTLVTEDKVLTEAAKAAARELRRRRHRARHHQRPAAARHEHADRAARSARAPSPASTAAYSSIPTSRSSRATRSIPRRPSRPLKLILDQGLDAWVYTEEEWLIRDRGRAACGARGMDREVRRQGRGVLHGRASGARGEDRRRLRRSRSGRRLREGGAEDAWARRRAPRARSPTIST